MYPAKRGYFSREELGHLACSLGFPASIFERGFCAFSSSPELVSPHGVSESSLRDMLDSKALNETLEKTFNEYPAMYNVKLVKKACYVLRRCAMTFGEIGEARVSFGLYSCEDASGMPADLATVTRALKFVERLMSPTRLQTEIQKQQLYSEAPNRIQMYEFFDLVIMCQPAEMVERSMMSSHSLDSEDTRSESDSSNVDISLPDFKELLMTTDQKMLQFLEGEYTSSIFKEVKPSPALLDTGHIVSNGPRRKLLCRAKEEARAITPSLEESQTQLNQARNGVYVFTTQQYSSISASNNARHSTSTSPQMHALQVRTPSHRRPKVSRQGGRSQSMPATPLHNLLFPGQRRKIDDLPQASYKTPRIQFQRVPTLKQRPVQKVVPPCHSTTSSISAGTMRGPSRRRNTPLRTSCPVSPLSWSFPLQLPVVVSGASSRLESDEHELSAAISSLCVDSVTRARSAVKSSMSASLQHGASTEKESKGSWGEVVLDSQQIGLKNSLPDAPNQRRESGLQSLVTPYDREVHQGLIDDLKWNELRKGNRDYQV